MVFAQYDAKLKFIRKRSKKLNQKSLIERMSLISSASNPIQELLNCCKEICDLSAIQLLKETSQEKRLVLISAIKEQALVYDPDSGYETISRAVYMLKQVCETHTERHKNTSREPVLDKPLMNRGSPNQLNTLNN